MPDWMERLLLQTAGGFLAAMPIWMLCYCLWKGPRAHLTLEDDPQCHT